MNEPIVDLIGHQKRACLVQWHPTASNVLMSAGSDQRLIVWNVELGSILFSVDDKHSDLIQSIAWNWNGSRIVSTCKDKMIRVIDPRKEEVVKVFKGHDGAKPARALFLKDGKVLTTGFSRMSCRQYALWDVDGDCSKPIILEDMDTSNGVMFPYYDPDIELIYLFGKGDCVIRYFEYTPETSSIHYLNTFISSEPQRGGAFMPKRGLNVNNCEVARFYKLHNVGLCETVSFLVPRKSDLFQNDLYPDTRAEMASITSEQWQNGEDSNPTLKSVRSAQEAPVSNRATFASVRRTKTVVDRGSNLVTVAGDSASPPQSNEQIKLDSPGQLGKLASELGELRMYVLKLERRVAELEKNRDGQIAK